MRLAEASASSACLSRTRSIVEGKYTPHPFASDIERNKIGQLLAEYLAMSALFPYLQAGAQWEAALAIVEQGDEIPRSLEVTSVIGNFLTADESGVNYVLSTWGIEGLPRILETSNNFHSHLLRADIGMLLGEPIAPALTERTQEYLKALAIDLSSTNTIRRVAAMVAFENHAESMIEALWETLSQMFDVDRDELTYFRVHVGGDDPAEQHHVRMTAEMIDLLVDPEDIDIFVGHFEECYRLNFNWCRSLVRE